MFYGREYPDTMLCFVMAILQNFTVQDGLRIIENLGGPQSSLGQLQAQLRISRLLCEGRY